MNSLLALAKRKTYFDPLLNFKSDDPIFVNLEVFLKEIMTKEDESSVRKKDIFLHNLQKQYRVLANKTDMDLRIYLVFLPMWAIAGVFFLYMFFTDAWPQINEVSIFATFAITFITIRPFYLIYNYIIGFLRIEDLEKKIIQDKNHLPRSKFPEVWAPILDFCDAIDLDNKRVHVVYVKENHFVPSVTDFKRIGRKLIVITIPRNLLVLSKKDPELYSAIIAHEMSHVEQGDSGIWMNHYLEQLCAFNLVDLIGNLIVGKEKRLKQKYKAYNSSAEYLADLGSFIFTQNTRIFDFLTGNYLVEDEGDFHPGREKRIKFLKAILYREVKVVYR